MAIFGHQHGLYPFFDKEKELCLKCMFRWKGLGFNFSKIYESSYKNEKPISFLITFYI